MVSSAPLLSTPSVKPHSRHAGPASGRAHPAWSSERLSAALASSFTTESVVVLANRQPFSHDWMPGQGIVVSRSSGGLVTALEPVMRACSGVWVAHGSGNGGRGRRRSVIDVRVPPATGVPAAPRLAEGQEEQGYYYGFANEGLWPLCHDAGVSQCSARMTWKRIATVNAAIRRSRGGGSGGRRPVVLVQDYHFALAPRYDSRAPAARDDHHFLAHPVAERGAARHLPVVARDAARPPGQQHRRIPDDRHCTELPRLGRCLPRAASIGHRTSSRTMATGRRAGVSDLDRVAEQSGVGVAACRCLPRGGPSRAGSGARIAPWGRRRSPRLHQGHRRSFCAVEKLLRGPSRSPRTLRLRPARGAEPDGIDRISRYQDERSRRVRTHQRTLRHANVSADRPAAQDTTSRRRSSASCAAPTCATSAACTTA